MSATRFVLLASPRTGTNLLNRNVNQLPGVRLHGEVFNPGFIGFSDEHHARFGTRRKNVAERDIDPLALLQRIWDDEGADAVGFHLFPGHDPNVLATVLDDSSVRKITLRRSLFQSYVSLRIAEAEDLWIITADQPLARERDPNGVQVRFDTEDFERYETRLRHYWQRIFSLLSGSGQASLDLFYSTINKVETINQIAEFLGVPGRVDSLKKTLVKQNPDELSRKVTNYEDLERYARSRNLEQHLW